MYTVHQHWDPLKVCAVGKSYPPEFYSRIKNPKIRNVLERIAIETEEDYQKLISKLEEFNVTVLRTDVSEDPEVYVNNGILNVPPPMCPRDFTAMIGDTFYMPGYNYGDNFDVNDIIVQIFEDIYRSEGNDTTHTISKEIEDCLESDNKVSPEESFKRLKSRMWEGTKQNQYMNSGVFGNKTNLVMRLPNGNKTGIGKLKFFIDFKGIIEKIIAAQTLTIGSNFKFPNNKRFYAFSSIQKFLQDNNVPIVYDTYVNSASTTRIGKDLFFASMNIVNEFNKDSFKQKWVKQFPDYNIHPVTVDGHSDGSFCPVVPGLIIALRDAQNYKETFPDWEVVYLEKQSWSKVASFLKMKKKNKGKWWIPGEEDNDELINYVETWLNDWVTYVEETVFDVNMLVINEQNVICNGYNKQVFDAFERYNITPHIVNFRHRYFWDGGLHCITSDIAREGEQKDLFTGF